ncbi:FAD-binding oxidoreductase [Nonomuraea sp. NBC_01738]|uniref:FAD-binding oxidoreductase n=1 Tax=Nonomuraea sp. NBC_01738 TaxID=2976003 RepID=UPI002E15AF0F|nr:FAD-binding oxidoreductase [Nonomuraea sp. NBC_01738]
MHRRDLLKASALLPFLTAGATAPPDWAGLRRGLSGTLVRPGDASYDQARRLFNPVYDAIRPGGVAYCASSADVARYVSFARTTGVPLTPRSGGHSYAGWSTGSGLVVDVSRMNTVAYRDGLATIGAGAKLMDVYTKLAAHGVSIPGGSCPTVGVAGLALGGGIGVVARKHGLTCDKLESVRIVTADGRVLDCDERHHDGLYWACRGGGGGNFGVVTSMTFRTHAARDVTVFFLHWPWARAAKAVKAWQSWAPTAPDELWSTLHLSREHTALDVSIGGLYLGGQAALERHLAPLTAKLGPPSSRVVRGVTYLRAMQIMAGGPAVRESFTAKSHIAYGRLGADGIAALVSHVARPGRHAVLLDAFGGAISRVSPGDTAFPHRRALFSVQYYQQGTSRSWLRGVHAAMRPELGDHAYVNYIDPDLTGWRSAYYGGNLDRLARVKSTYDPDRLFRLPQGI